MMSMYIEKGEPTRHGWKRLKFYVSEYYNPDWENFDENERLPHDNEFFSFTFLMRLPIRTLDKVKDIK
jgi:hypothetical protein